MQHRQGQKHNVASLPHPADAWPSAASRWAYRLCLTHAALCSAANVRRPLGSPKHMHTHQSINVPACALVHMLHTEACASACAHDHAHVYAHARLHIYPHVYRRQHLAGGAMLVSCRRSADAQRRRATKNGAAKGEGHPHPPACGHGQKAAGSAQWVSYTDASRALSKDYCKSAEIPFLQLCKSLADGGKAS